MAAAMTNNNTKRPFAFEVLTTTMNTETLTTSMIGLEEDEGGTILGSVCSPGSPTKRYRPSRLQVDKMGSSGVDPFPSLDTPLRVAATASVDHFPAHTMAATLKKELAEREACSKSMRRSFLAPLEVDDDAVGVDPFLPSFTKTGHQMLGVRETKPWEQDGCEWEEKEVKAVEGTMTEEGGVADRSLFLGFDDEDEHVQLQQLAMQLAAIGK